MPSTDALRKNLADVEAELAGLGSRRAALEQAADDLRSAIASLDALDGRGAATPKKKSAPRSKRPAVTPDDLLSALSDLGGTGTVEQLVEALGLTDGRSLNGARRVAVEAGTITYQDRTYTRVS